MCVSEWLIEVQRTRGGDAPPVPTCVCITIIDSVMMDAHDMAMPEPQTCST